MKTRWNFHFWMMYIVRVTKEVLHLFILLLDQIFRPYQSAVSWGQCEKIYKNVLLFMENHLMLQWAVCIHLHLHNWSRRWRSHLIWAGIEDGGAMCRLSFCVHTLILLIGYISFLCPHTWFSTPPRFLLLFLFYFPYLPIP